MAYEFFGALIAAAVYELINNEKDNVNEVIENLTSYVLYGISG
jgi:hypothetical protein